MENSGEGANKQEGKEAVDYSLVLSEIYHRVIKSQQNYSEEAYKELISEIEDIFIEVGFADNFGGIKYRAENHEYFLNKKEIFDSTKFRSYKDLFWKGFIVRHNEDDYLEKSDQYKNVVNNDSSAETLSGIDESNPFRNIGTILNPTSDDEMRYDIFSVKSSKFVVNLTEGNTDSEMRFSLFFNWYLSTLSSYEIKPFLEYHFKNGFASDLQNFKRFVKLTIAEDRNEIIPEFSREVAFEEVETLMKQSESKIERIERDMPNEANNGKSIVINLPKIDKREKNDEVTKLTLNATAILIQLLLKEKALINDTKILADVNVRKAFKVLTGYNEQNLYTAIKEFNIEKLDTQSKAEVVKVKLILKNMIMSLENKKN